MEDCGFHHSMRLGFIFKKYGYYNLCKWYYTHGNSPRMARKVIAFTPGKSIRIWWLWASFEPSFPTFSDTTGTPNTITQRILTQLEHLNMWSKDEQRSWKLKCYHITSYNSCNSLYVAIHTIILHHCSCHQHVENSESPASTVHRVCLKVCHSSSHLQSWHCGEFNSLGLFQPQNLK